VAAPPASTAPGRQRLMRDAFGPHADAVFTPPWNRCEPAVADALVTLGFEVLSRDASAPRLDRPDLVERVMPTHGRPRSCLSKPEQLWACAV
jgi:hypothetical protein